MCLVGGAALVLCAVTPADSQPVVIRGIPSPPAASELRLAYVASFPSGSLEPSVDHLGAGALVPGDPLIPDSNPTVSALPGEVLVSIHRPIGLSPDLIPSESLWATPVDFGPGSVVRLTATFRAPVGPIPGGGFAFGMNARTGAKDDLPTETRIATTINVRPGFLVRLNVPFGATQGTAMVLPAAVRDAMFSTSVSSTVHAHPDDRSHSRHREIPAQSGRPGLHPELPTFGLPRGWRADHHRGWTRNCSELERLRPDRIRPCSRFSNLRECRRITLFSALCERKTQCHRNAASLLVAPV